MAWEQYNPNPCGRSVGDCAVRAIAKALDVDWEKAYVILSVNGFQMCDLPNADATWGATLRQHGFHRRAVEDTCPDCYTAEDFCQDHPVGTYVLGFGGHVATIQNGILYDSFDSGALIPQFYWFKPDEEA